MYIGKSLLTHNFRSVGWFLDSPKNPKDASNFDLSRSSNSNFSSTECSIFSLKVSGRNLHLGKENLLQRTLHRDLVQMSDSLRNNPELAHNKEPFRY